MEIRGYQPADASALLDVFRSAIHLVAARDYTPEQIAAWAPDEIDATLWATKMADMQPFVAVRDGVVVGYADVQPSGYIDHFFVSGHHPRQGIGGALMRHLLETAAQQRVGELTSHVSVTAQPFFARFGFVVAEQRMPVVRGVAMPNALMRRVGQPPLRHG